jgi:signal transduction histidine kinase
MQKIQGECYALRYLDSADELRAALQTASQETDRLLQLASDLLLIASSDRGQLPLRLECLSAREVLDSVRQRFAWRADAGAAVPLLRKGQRPSPMLKPRVRRKRDTGACSVIGR